MPLLEFVKLLLDVKEGLLPLCCPQHLLHVALVQMVTWPLFCHLLICLWDKVFLCSPGWPRTHNSPMSAFQVVGVQACTICLASFISENNTQPPNFSSKTCLNLELLFLYCKATANPSSDLSSSSFLLHRPRKLKFTKAQAHHT